MSSCVRAYACVFVCVHMCVFTASYGEVACSTPAPGAAPASIPAPRGDSEYALPYDQEGANGRKSELESE